MLYLSRYMYIPVIADFLPHPRIWNGLSGAALKFYEREFSFCRKVMKISGITRHDYMSSCVSCCLSVHAYPLICRLEVVTIFCL